VVNATQKARIERKKSEKMLNRQEPRFRFTGKKGPRKKGKKGETRFSLEYYRLSEEGQELVMHIKETGTGISEKRAPSPTVKKEILKRKREPQKKAPPSVGGDP